MASLNIASLVKHIHELRIILDDQYFDAVAINETRLAPVITDNPVQVNGYTILRKYRNRNGGGVCLYLRSNPKCPY